MSEIDVTKMYSPLASAVFHMEQSVNCLRPNYTQGLMRLVDCAEVFLQFGALCALCAWRSNGIEERKGTSKAVKFISGTFFTQPLSAGHYLQAWQVIGRAFPDASQHPFGPYATLVAGKLDKEIMATITALPQFRNKNKGHAFTQEDGPAELKWKKWYPRVCQLFADVTRVTEKYRLCLISDSDGDAVELKILQGNVRHRNAGVELVEAEGGRLIRGSVVLATQGAIARGSLVSEVDFIDLSPAVISGHDQIFWYQGVRGKRAEYLSIDNETHEDVDDESFRAGYSFLNGFQVSQPESPAVPDWAKSLNGCEYLCDAVINPRAANPIGFYRGARCSWADIRESLDVSRRVKFRDCCHDLTDFVSDNARAWSVLAKSYEVPLFTVVGAAGAGKTTALWRMAYEIFKHHRDQWEIVRQLPGGPIDEESLSSVVENVGGKAICLIIDDAHEFLSSIENLRQIARERELPIFILAAERTNVWPQHIGQLINLEKLTDDGIDQLLDKLEQGGQLGVLENLPHGERHELVKSGLGRELIVALKEATEGRRFDELIYGEYSGLPTEHARRLYKQICLCDCVGHHLPSYVAMSTMGCERVSELRSKVLGDLKDVVRSDKTAYGRGYQSRHRLIAEVVVSGIKDPQEVLDALSDLLLHLSLGKGPRGGLWPSSLSLAKSIFAWPCFHELLAEDVDAMALVRDMRQYGAYVGEIIFHSFSKGELVENAGLLAFVEELLADCLKSAVAKQRASLASANVDALSRVISALVASGELDRAVKIGDRAFEVYGDMPKCLGVFIQQYSMILVEAGYEQDALGVIRSCVNDLDWAKYTPSLACVVSAVVKPLCIIGHIGEAVDFCNKAVELIPEGSGFLQDGLAVQLCRLLIEYGPSDEAILRSEQLLDRAIELGIPSERLSALVHQVCAASAKAGGGEFTRITLKLHSLSVVPDLRMLGGMLGLDHEGKFSGEPRLVQMAEEFAQTHGVANMVIGSLKRQSEVGDCVSLVSGDRLVSLVSNDPQLSAHCRSTLVYYWLKCALAVWPNQPASLMLDQTQSLHEGLDLSYLEDVLDIDIT